MINGSKFGLKKNLIFWPSGVIAPAEFRPQMRARKGEPCLAEADGVSLKRDRRSDPRIAEAEKGGRGSLAQKRTLIRRSEPNHRSDPYFGKRETEDVVKCP